MRVRVSSGPAFMSTRVDVVPVKAVPANVSAFLGTKKPREPGVSNETVRRASRQLDDILADQTWSKFRPIHALVLYIRLHEAVYGIEPADLTEKERHNALLRIGNVLKNDFNGDTQELCNFIRWSWSREESREEWRRQNRRSGFRLTWRLQYSGSVLTDYRLDVMRRRGSR